MTYVNRARNFRHFSTCTTDLGCENLHLSKYTCVQRRKPTICCSTRLNSDRNVNHLSSSCSLKCQTVRHLFTLVVVRGQPCHFMSFWRLNCWNAWVGAMPYILSTWQDLTGFRVSRTGTDQKACVSCRGYCGHWMLATSWASAARRSGCEGTDGPVIWRANSTPTTDWSSCQDWQGRFSGAWIACLVDLHRKSGANYNQFPPCLRLFLLLLLLLLLLLTLLPLCWWFVRTFSAHVPGEF